MKSKGKPKEGLYRRMLKKVSATRKLGGKTYYARFIELTKAGAERSASKLRAKGLKARITYDKPRARWVVWWAD